MSTTYSAFLYIKKFKNVGMTNITLDTTLHHGKPILLIRFPFNHQLIEISKKLSGAMWSKTFGAWYVPYSKQALLQVKENFEGIANLDATVLKAKLLKVRNTPAFIRNHVLSEDKNVRVGEFKRWLCSRRYSECTIATYINALQAFLKFYYAKPIKEITNDDIINYNNNYILANKLSASYQNQAVNAIKLFFKTIEGTSMDIDLIHRPKNPKVLPNVLSRQEVKKILEVPTFLKHKAMLSLIYSCGLRCGEVLRLKLEHVDSKRNILLIKQSKGSKDRIAPLSDKTIEMLRTYFKAFKPKLYLFEGEKEGSQYTERSLQHVLKQCVAKAGIKKPVTLHWLRHSYATHLLENGTDLRYIQEILGHSSSKTTEIYTHVSTKSIQNITSPFDLL